MKFKPIYIYLALMLGTTVFFVLNVIGVSLDDSEISIEEYNAVIDIDNDGDMHVTESWFMHYEGDYNVRFRDFEYDKFPEDYPLAHTVANFATFNTETYNTEIYKNSYVRTSMVTVGYSFNEDRDERYEYVACPPSASDNCESFFVNATAIGGLSGDIEFIYEYVIENVITEYSDISELNWVLFDYAESKVDSGYITINLPNAFSTYDLFTPTIKNSTFVVEDEDTIHIDFTNLSKKESLGFRLLVPTSTFTDIAPANTFINESINKQVILDFEASLASDIETANDIYLYTYIITFVISLISILALKFVLKLAFRPHPVEISSNIVSPPTEDSPAYVGYIFNDMTLLPEHVSATLLDLIYRDYLVVDDSNETIVEDYSYNADDDRNDTILFLNKEKNLDELKEYEAFLIKWYIEDLGDGEKVSLSKVSLVNKTEIGASIFVKNQNDFERSLKRETRKLVYYDINTNARKINSHFTLILPMIGFVLLFIANSITYDFYLFQALPLLLATIYIIITINNKKLRSPEGEKFYQDWKSYKDNLETMSVINVSNIDDVEYWDYHLIYAALFGLSEEILEQLKVTLQSSKATTDNDYYHRSHRNRFNRYYMYHRISRNYNNSYRKSNTRVIQSRRSSSRSGGGGSFGGGGGGGRSR